MFNTAGVSRYTLFFSVFLFLFFRRVYNKKLGVKEDSIKADEFWAGLVIPDWIVTYNKKLQPDHDGSWRRTEHFRAS